MIGQNKNRLPQEPWSQRFPYQNDPGKEQHRETNKSKLQKRQEYGKMLRELGTKNQPVYNVDKVGSPMRGSPQNRGMKPLKAFK